MFLFASLIIMIQRTTNCVPLATHCGTSNYDVIEFAESDILRRFVYF
ncbi:hypothetical protein M23134_07309 [Microscilla marina ATCC 23134]|uniref:Uncharacterized protein n=1 Tax=Microscilla marina ATCC 23134 TaxID=313606 RepID=A1ZVG0_MICM2|nr:hypothetical protein M23134_07309 [Microscilla marina ATCC 23134]